MKRRLLTAFFLFTEMYLQSQTGPAGVGTSANNVLWLKADAGTSTVTSGAAVSSWIDQSGNGNTVSQATANQQPLYTTNLINGFPAIQFDNVTTTNDKMTGADSPTLDNTAGYTFFTISRQQNLDGAARVILSKRTTVSVDQSFMLFYYSSNKFHIDVQTTNDRFNSNAVFANNTNYLIDLVYDGTLAAASRCKLYKSGTLDITATETSSSVPDNASPLIIGSTDAADPRPFGGYIAEVLVYRTALNKASRIIVDNYLSAKYNVALTSNDFYAGDNAGIDFDREVAGVGSDTTQPGSIVGSNTAFASSIAAGLGITVNSGLDVGDYILAGHASLANAQILTDVNGMSGTANARWQRIWYVDVTNTSTAINTNIEFDMSDGGVGAITLGTVSDYVLLYRATNTAGTAWTELTTASTIAGDKVKFNGYNLTLDGYYTIGTKNYPVSPLPIELLNFNAIMNNGKVDLTWETATETNNDHFTIERSKDGITFETVSVIQGAGSSTFIRNYADQDQNPYSGISYYRLKQTDFNGQSSYSSVVAVNYYFGDDGVSIYPNPANSDSPMNLSIKGLENQEILVVVKDISGREFYSKVIITTSKDQLEAIDTEHRLAAGTYIVIASSNNKVYSQKLIIK